jgi:hypothetical protein
MTDHRHAAEDDVEAPAVTNPRARDMALLNLRWMTATGAAASIGVAGAIAGMTAAAHQAAPPVPVTKTVAKVAPVTSVMPPLTDAQLAALNFGLPIAVSTHSASAGRTAAGSAAGPAAPRGAGVAMSASGAVAGPSAPGGAAPAPGLAPAPPPAAIAPAPPPAAPPPPPVAGTGQSSPPP